MAALVWMAASVAFFGYVLAVSTLLTGVRARTLAIAGCGLGLALTAAAWLTTSAPVVHEWLVPPILLLLGYWTSGLLFVAPMPGVEALLGAIDRRLSIDHLAHATPRWLAEVLELAYLGVYPLVPLALVARVAFLDQPDPAHFWAVILVTDFVCFGCLPWIQTRPPRALGAVPWSTSLRRLNVSLLGKASIDANTFPSGHAAEALAAALLVIGTPWPVVTAFGVAALLVSLGAVLGRYHYAADAVAGWVVAVVVWVVL